MNNANKFINNIEILPINLYYDFKKGISNAATNSFPNINIKFVFGIIKDQKKNKK